MQAVRASDFSIAQFRFLERLLIVHGSWCYKRVSKFILFYFYKNMANVLTEYFFAYFCAFSGQILFADWLSLGYNAVYTSFACIFGFSLDQDINVETIKKYPRTYEYSMLGMGFDMWKFFAWVLVAFWHAACCFFVPMFFTRGVIDDSGMAMGNWFHGTTSFSCVIIVVHIKMCLMVYSFNWLVNSFLIISLALFFISIIILCFEPVSKQFQFEMMGMVFLLFRNSKFWFAMLLTNFLAILPDMLLKIVWTLYFPQVSLVTL